MHSVGGIADCHTTDMRYASRWNAQKLSGVIGPVICVQNIPGVCGGRTLASWFS